MSAPDKSDDDVVNEYSGLVSNARPPVPHTAAIPIYPSDNSDDDVCPRSREDSDSSSGDSEDEDVDDDNRGERSSLCGASPGAGSYVFDADSWRPVPPPMLASSFDRRMRPSLCPKTKLRRLHSLHPSYGAADQTGKKRRHSELRLQNEKVKDAGVTPVSRLNRPRKLAKPGQLHRGAVEASLKHPVHVPSASWNDKIAKASVQWRAIARAPRELWIIFALKLLSSCMCTSYFVLFCIGFGSL